MSLSFLTPLMLAGAALVAAPIILHLVMRQQPKHLVFPALRFIRRREEANRRQLRLRHLILLALRCGAILFLALAVARPTLQSAGLLGDQEAPVAAALIFDTSPRMEYRHENQTRLEVAQQGADRVLAQLPAESEVAVLDCRNLAAAFAIDGAVARQRIERLRPTAAARPLTEVCEDALRLVRDSDKPRKEIYVFTDLGQTAWPAESTERLRDTLGADRAIALYVIDVGVDKPRDLGLGDLRLAGESLAKNTPLRVETDVVAVGPDEQRTVVLSLLDVNGQPQVRAQTNARPQPDQPQPIDFQLAGLEEGTHQGFVRITGEDGLAADDTRFFTVDVRPPWNILVAAPKPADRHAVFLTEALAPAAFRRSAQARFECEVIPIDDLASKRLDDYAAVCLLDPPPLADAVWDGLSSYVEAGGGLAIWLGPGAQPKGKGPDQFSSTASQRLLPGKLARQWHRQDAFLAPQDYQHPLLARFRSIAGGVPWDAFTIWSHWQLSDLAAGANTIIPYSNGQAALVERIVGKGRVLVMTTSISEDASQSDLWNLLAVGSEPWPFVMLTNEMLLYLVGSGEERQNYLAGQVVTLNLPENQRQLIYSLRTPDGQDLPQSVDQQAGTVTVTTTDAPGNYLLRAGGTEGGVRLGFSVNIPASATNLTRLSRDDLTALLGKDRFRLAHNRQEIERDVSLGRTGRELYSPLVVLVAIILGLEYLLANKFYRRAPPVETPRRYSTTTPADASQQPEPVGSA